MGLRYSGSLLNKKLSRLSYLGWCFLFFSSLPLAFVSASPYDYYRLHFQGQKRHPLRDTLFKKTVWYQKVSHLVLEQKGNKHLVTLLMILPYPYNYKSKNYALHYQLSSWEEAMQKFQWLDHFLEEGGVLQVNILGSIIQSEVILNPAGL